MTETKFSYHVENYSILLLRESDQSPNFASAALLVLLVITLATNSFVLLSILWSPLRSSPHNAAIATVTGVALVDGLFNLTTSVVFHASWSELPHFYGEETVRLWCRSNAAVLQSTSVILSFALAVLSYDRLSVVKERRGGDFPSRSRERLHAGMKWTLLLSVLGSAVLALPISFGVLETRLFQQRMSCSPVHASRQPEAVLIAVWILVTYAAVWFFILRNSYLIARRVLNERRRLIRLELVARQRAAERGSPRRGLTNFNSGLLDQIWGSSNGDGLPVYVLTALLIASFMLAVVPNVVAVQVTQFYAAYDVEEEFSVFNRTVPRTDLGSVRTDVIDSIFAWTRHGYNAFSPGLILLVHGEVRKQCKVTFCCCCSGSKTYVRRQSKSISDFLRDLKWQKRKKTVADYRIPVLFATSEGLHLRTVRGVRLGEEEPQFIIKFCDLTLEESNSKQQTPVQVNSERNLNEKTFVVKNEKSTGERKFGETFVKFPNGFDGSKISRDRSGTIELGLISENGCSLLSLSQRMRNRDPS